MTKNVRHGAVDRRIAPPAFLIGGTAPVADHGDDEPVLYAPALSSLARQPGDRPYGPGGEQKSVAVPRPQSDHSPGEMGEQRNSRAIVIGKRWVANMRRKQEFLVGFALVQIFAVGQGPAFQA